MEKVISEKNVKTQFLKNVGSGYLAVAVTGLVGFVMIPLNMRMLGQDVYGISTMATAALNVLSFLSFGMGPTLLRFFSQAIAQNNRTRLKELSTTAQALLGGLGVIGAGVFMMSYPRFISFYEISAEYHFGVFVLFAAMAFSFWEQLFLVPFFSVIQGSNRYDLGNLIRIFSVLLRLSVLYVGYHFSATLPVLAAAFAVEAVFRLILIPIVGFSCLGKTILFSPRAIRLNLLPSLFSFSVINLANSFFFNLSVQIPILIIGKTLGAEMVAAFNPAVTLSGFLASILGITSAPLTPLASRDAAGGGGNLGRWAVLIAQFIACLGGGILVVFALFGENFLAIWLRGQGLEWTNPVIMVSIFGVIIASTQTANYNLALGGGSILPFAVSSFVMFILTVAGTWIGTSFFGWTLLVVAVYIAIVRGIRNIFFLGGVYSRLFHYSFGYYFRKVYLEPALVFAGTVVLLFPLKRFLPENVSLPILIPVAVATFGFYGVIVWRWLLCADIKAPLVKILRRKKS